MTMEVDGTSCTCRQDKTSEKDIVGSKDGGYEELLPDPRICIGLDKMKTVYLENSHFCSAENMCKCMRGSLLLALLVFSPVFLFLAACPNLHVSLLRWMSVCC